MKTRPLIGALIGLIIGIGVNQYLHPKIIDADILGPPLPPIIMEVGVTPIETSKPLVVPIYKIGLSEDLQEFTYHVCSLYEVEYELVLAVMYKESSYNVTALNGRNYGLMQINIINYEELHEALGITDITDAKENITCGVYMLRNLLREYNTTDTLMVYNAGAYGASQMWSKGIKSTEYSRGVIAYRNQLKKQK